MVLVSTVDERYALLLDPLVLKESGSYAAPPSGLLNFRWHSGRALGCARLKVGDICGFSYWAVLCRQIISVHVLFLCSIKTKQSLTWAAQSAGLGSELIAAVGAGLPAVSAWVGTDAKLVVDFAGARETFGWLALDV